MKKRVSGRKWKIVVFLIIVLLVATVYFTFFYKKKCEDISCFDSQLYRCRKTKFTENGERAVWYYEIEERVNEAYTLTGKKGGECAIYVKLIQAKEGDLDLLESEGHDMICYLPYSVVAAPHQNIERCHGVLKEDMQQVIIQRMHKYILDNLGEIQEEFQKVL
ncbi:MAG: hypothetical protein ABIE22_03845 [archaeon]